MSVIDLNVVMCATICMKNAVMNASGNGGPRCNHYYIRHPGYIDLPKSLRPMSFLFRLI